MDTISLSNKHQELGICTNNVHDTALSLLKTVTRPIVEGDTANFLLKFVFAKCLFLKRSARA